MTSLQRNSGKKEERSPNCGKIKQNEVLPESKKEGAPPCPLSSTTYTRPIRHAPRRQSAVRPHPAPPGDDDDSHRPRRKVPPAPSGDDDHPATTEGAARPIRRRRKARRRRKVPPAPPEDDDDFVEVCRGDFSAEEHRSVDSAEE